MVGFIFLELRAPPWKEMTPPRALERKEKTSERNWDAHEFRISARAARKGRKSEKGKENLESRKPMDVTWFSQTSVSLFIWRVSFFLVPHLVARPAALKEGMQRNQKKA